MNKVEEGQRLLKEITAEIETTEDYLNTCHEVVSRPYLSMFHGMARWAEGHLHRKLLLLRVIAGGLRVAIMFPQEVSDDSTS